MKKISVAAFLLLFMVLSAYATEVPARSIPEDNRNNYTIESTGDSTFARITGYSGSRAEIRIPNRINGMNIIAIEDRVFAGRKLTSVIIPNNVILIGSETFSRNEITSITIGANVTMNDNSFDSGFAGFYTGSGKKAGTYILSNGTWSMQIIANPTVEAASDKKTETKKKSSFKVDPYGNFSTSVGLWDYGPSTLVPRPSLYLGMLMSFDKLEIRFSAVGGGFLGIAYPDFEDFGIMYGSYFGSLIELDFPKKFCLGFGGGMTSFNFTTVNEKGENSFFPYTELNIFFDSSLGIFLRYYFNDDNLYNKFSAGIIFNNFL